jgi:hypothetical protein
MSAAAAVHKPGNRILELSPFELGPELKDTLKPQISLAGPAYGCVEWFHYIEEPAARPASPRTAPARPSARRR